MRSPYMELAIFPC